VDIRPRTVEQPQDRGVDVPVLVGSGRAHTQDRLGRMDAVPRPAPTTFAQVVPMYRWMRRPCRLAGQRHSRCAAAYAGTGGRAPYPSSWRSRKG
jgi:hypothetical protein